MSIDTIGRPQAYGTPLFSPFDLDLAQVVIILENPGDPKQPKRSAEVLLELGTSEHDDLLIQASNEAVHSGDVILRLNELIRNKFGIYDFSHDPNCSSWDLDEVYLEAKKIYLEAHNLRRELKGLAISNLSSDESEKYQSIAKRAFDDQQGVEQPMADISHQSFEEIVHNKEMLEKAIEERKNRKLQELSIQFLPRRQSALIEKIGEFIDKRANIPEKMERRIYVLCEGAHAYVNPETNCAHSAEVGRLINFVMNEKKHALTIIDASSDSCIKKTTETTPVD